MSEIAEPEPAQKLETKDLFNVEIWSTGTFNGDTYTVDDLEDMVRNHLEVGEQLKPYLKLGHDDGQGMLQKDGYPAAGWVTNLRRHGEKLYADLRAIPAKIADLIDAKAYGRFSPEIYWNLKDAAGSVRRRVLGALAILGADTPANMGINDFVSNFYTDESILKTYHVIKQESIMTEQEIAVLRAEYESLRAEAEKTKLYAAELETKAKAEAERATKLEQEKFQTRVDAAWKTYSGKKLLPKQEGIFKALCHTRDAELKTYSHQIGEGKAENYDLDSVDLVCRLVDGLDDLPFGETRTQYTDRNKQREEGAMTDEDLLDKRAREYMLEQVQLGQKIKYADALRAIASEVK